MEGQISCVKVLPFESSSSTRRCGVCEELLVIPPIYSCKSVQFICGPCFEGYRYYLDDDDLRATDNPIRQILYENYAREVRFPCSYHPHCKGEMFFDQGARLHYEEFCLAKVLWIFKCPISRANRWYLRPDQEYCSWRYKQLVLYENENEKMTQHLREVHREYILERPYILQLMDLKHFPRTRQIFLLLLEENNLVAVIMTEITKTDIIFRCRVNDAIDNRTAKTDPYECSVTLVPPNERFSSMVDLKFECVNMDSNQVEYPWQSLRLPLRHLVEETNFKICILPRSHMLRSIPYFHRDRQLFSGTEETPSETTLTASECGSSVTESTLSIVESNKTDIELLSLASSNNMEQPDVGDLKEVAPSSHLRLLKLDTSNKPQHCGPPNLCIQTERPHVNRNLFNEATEFYEAIFPEIQLLSDSSKDNPSLIEILDDLPDLIEVKDTNTSGFSNSDEVIKKSSIGNDEKCQESFQFSIQDTPPKTVEDMYEEVKHGTRNNLQEKSAENVENFQGKSNKPQLKKNLTESDQEVSRYQERAISNLETLVNELNINSSPNIEYLPEKLSLLIIPSPTRRKPSRSVGTAENLVNGKNNQMEDVPKPEQLHENNNGIHLTNDRNTPLSASLGPKTNGTITYSEHSPCELVAKSSNIKVSKGVVSGNHTEYTIESIPQDTELSRATSCQTEMIIFDDRENLDQILEKNLSNREMDEELSNINYELESSFDQNHNDISLIGETVLRQVDQTEIFTDLPNNNCTNGYIRENESEYSENYLEKM